MPTPAPYPSSRQHQQRVNAKVREAGAVDPTLLFTLGHPIVLQNPIADQVPDHQPTEKGHGALPRSVADGLCHFNLIGRTSGLARSTPCFLQQTILCGDSVTL